MKVAFSEGLARFAASNARNLPYSAAQSSAHGLPRAEALKGITLNTAEILGVAKRLGSIEAGKEATLFTANGDILEIRTQVKQMWIAGKKVSLDNRHNRLYKKYRNRPKPKKSTEENTPSPTSCLSISTSPAFTKEHERKRILDCFIGQSLGLCTQGGGLSRRPYDRPSAGHHR